MNGRSSKFVLLNFITLLAVAGPANAQYPMVSKADGREAARRFTEMNQRSDEAWANALPTVNAWAKKGKPYLPAAQKPSDLPQAEIPAFPGARGGGMYSYGGRGGTVFVVTSLEDRGPGTLREALKAGGPRIVVFNVAGIIRLKERIRIRAPYITISGATAPGDGVCIAGDTVELDTHDVIIRHMRFRRATSPVDDYGRAYVAGNFVEGNEKVSKDNWDGGVQVDSIGDAIEVLKTVRSDKPYPHAYLDLQSAKEAYDYVLANAGATLPRRDGVDERIVETVHTGKVTSVAGANIREQLANPNFSEKMIDKLVHEVSLGIITDVSQVGGYPEYNGQPYQDSDGDGMPNDWEQRCGLNPNDAADATADVNGDGYTNIEDFINGLNPSRQHPKWNAPRTYQDLWSSDPDLRASLERK